MKVVIDIPEDKYELFKREDCEAESYIADGTPLTEEDHGWEDLLYNWVSKGWI